MASGTKVESITRSDLQYCWTTEAKRQQDNSLEIYIDYVKQEIRAGTEAGAILCNVGWHEVGFDRDK